MGANVAVAQNAHEAFYMYWYKVPSCDNVYTNKNVFGCQKEREVNTVLRKSVHFL